MIADLDTSDLTELADYDVCIVGTGPAGTTLANELAGSGLRLCVLESGRLRPTPHGDRLRHVVSDGIEIKEYSRERVLGGASTTWAGLSSPLDPLDMAPRPWVPNSGWPVDRDALLPYYEQAAERYRFPSLDFFETGGANDKSFGALKSSGDAQPQWDIVTEKIFLACAEPQNFGSEFRELFEGPLVDVFLDATLLHLEAEGAGSPPDSSDDRRARATAGVLRTRSGREVRVRAKHFVLATGGIENARLLLKSRDYCDAGLGNEHDQVGRYLMNHPKNYHGILELDPPLEELPYFFGCLFRGYAGYAGLRLTDSLQREGEVLNSYVRFEPLFPWSDNDGIEALVLLAKRSQFFFKRWKASKQDEIVELRDYSETGDDSDLQNQRKSTWDWLGLIPKIIKGSPGVTRYLFFRLTKAKPKIRRVRLRNFMEMEPSPENRITLSEELDEYGQPLPHVRHQASKLDRRSMVAVQDALQSELARVGLGELTGRLEDKEPWPITQDASHHMGTTRMGTDPQTSVVDTNCRLHSVDNVYLAGASVFPTSGCANPTFTLVALSIRLAEELRGRVAADPRTNSRS